MSVLRSVIDGLRILFGRERFERELDDEVGHFIELETNARVQAGVPLAEARRQARASVGGVQRVKDDARDGGWEFTVDGVQRDVS